VNVIDAKSGELFILDATAPTLGRFIVQSDELLTAFLELEATWL